MKDGNENTTYKYFNNRQINEEAVRKYASERYDEIFKHINDIQILRSFTMSETVYQTHIKSMQETIDLLDSFFL